MDEDEQRILEHIQRTYPPEFVEKGMQVLKEIVLKRMRSQIELDARLDRMQAAAQREGVVLDRWECIIKGKCLAIIESSWAIREDDVPLSAPPRQAVEHEDEDASPGERPTDRRYQFDHWLETGARIDSGRAPGAIGAVNPFADAGAQID